MKCAHLRREEKFFNPHREGVGNKKILLAIAKWADLQRKFYNTHPMGIVKYKNNFLLKIALMCRYAQKN